MARRCVDVPVKGIQCAVDGMEVDDLLEEFESVIADLSVGEESDRGASSVNMLVDCA